MLRYTNGERQGFLVETRVYTGLDYWALERDFKIPYWWLGGRTQYYAKIGDIASILESLKLGGCVDLRQVSQLPITPLL